MKKNIKKVIFFILLSLVFTVQLRDTITIAKSEIDMKRKPVIIGGGLNEVKYDEEDMYNVAESKNENYKITIHEENVIVQVPLIRTSKKDKSYIGKRVDIIGKNRVNLERLVQGEAGAEGYIGAALVAQTIRDTMLLEDNYDVLSIKKKYLYSGKLITEPNEDVKNAVSFIFDEGGMVVQHRLIFFYAPARVSSDFHESQNFIIEYKGHKFFDLL